MLNDSVLFKNVEPVKHFKLTVIQCNMCTRTETRADMVVILTINCVVTLFKKPITNKLSMAHSLCRGVTYINLIECHKIPVSV